MEQTENLQEVISPSLTGLDPFDSGGDFQLPEANVDELLEELACNAPDQAGVPPDENTDAAPDQAEVPPDENTDALTDALPAFHGLPDDIWDQLGEELTQAENVPGSSLVGTACEGGPGNGCEHGNPNGQCPICKQEGVLQSQRAHDMEEARLAYERARKGLEVLGTATNQDEMLNAAKEVISARNKIQNIQRRKSMQRADSATKQVVDQYLRLARDETSIDHTKHLRGGYSLKKFIYLAFYPSTQGEGGAGGADDEMPAKRAKNV
jgi:hypothetical protein